jgi:hypothetical protein
MAHQETAGIYLEWLKNNVVYHEEQLQAGSYTETRRMILSK